MTERHVVVAPVNVEEPFFVAGDGCEDDHTSLIEPRQVSLWDKAEKWERRVKPVLYLLGISAFGVTTYAVPRAQGWAQEIADKAITKHLHGGAHPDAATKQDVENLKIDITKKFDAIMAALVPMKSQAVEAAKDRAAVLCKAIKKTEIKGDLCVLKKIPGRGKKTVPLVNLKALRAEVYGE